MQPPAPEGRRSPRRNKHTKKARTQTRPGLFISLCLFADVFVQQGTSVLNQGIDIFHSFCYSVIVAIAQNPVCSPAFYCLFCRIEVMFHSTCAFLIVSNFCFTRSKIQSRSNVERRKHYYEKQVFFAYCSVSLSRCMLGYIKRLCCRKQY